MTTKMGTIRVAVDLMDDNCSGTTNVQAKYYCFGCKMNHPLMRSDVTWDDE